MSSNSNNRVGGGDDGRGGGSVDPSPLLHSSNANNNNNANTSSSSSSSILFDTSHLQTYTAGEDAGRLANAARALGLSSHRRPRKQVRASQSRDGQQHSHSHYHRHHHSHAHHHHRKNTNSSRGIEGIVSDFISNVGVLFNDRTLEYARMHAVDSHLIVEGRVPLEPPGITATATTAAGLPILGLDRDKFKPEKEEEEEEEKEEMIDPHLSGAGAGGTIPAAIFGIIKAMVGPAILYLPHGFATSGYIVAIPIMLVCTGMYLYASRCLLECWRFETFGELLCQINVMPQEEESSSSSSSSSESGGNEQGEMGNDNPDGEDGIVLNEEMVRLVSFPEEEEDDGGAVQEETGIRSRNGSLSPPHERKYGTIAPDKDGDVDDEHNVIFNNVDEENGTQLVGMLKGRSSSITKNKTETQPLHGSDPPPPPASRHDHRTRTTTKHPKMLSYPELAYRALGSSGETFVMTGIALMQFGVCLTYLIFVPQNLHTSLITLFDLHVPLPLLLLGMIGLEIPLSWIRDIRKLTPTNILANALILFGLITCLSFAIGGAEERKETVWEELKGLDPVKSTWYLFIGTSVLLFEGSITLLVPLQEAVQGHYNRAVFPNVYSRVILSIIGFFLFFGITCWMSFGDSVNTVLTTSLPSGYLATSVQFAYSIAVIFTFPLQNFPALEIVCRSLATSYQSMSGKKDSLLVNRNFVSSILVCLLAMVALFTMDSLGNVVSLMGSLLGCPIAFVFPPLIHSQLIKGLPKATKMMDYIVAALGIVSTIAASILTVVTWGESKG